MDTDYASSLSIYEFWKRKNTLRFLKFLMNEHQYVSQACSYFQSLEKEKKNKKPRRHSSAEISVNNVRVFGTDRYSVNHLDGYDVDNKFMIVNSRASELRSRNYWALIWENNCNVIVRFGKNEWEPKNWLGNGSCVYKEGEFNIWKKTITSKYYTQLQLVLENKACKKSRKLMHYAYHEDLDGSLPYDSTQLVFFLKLVNNTQDDFRNKALKSKKNLPGPIVIHSVDRFERAISFCVLDICLDQLKKTKSVSVPNTLVKIKSQVPVESFSFDEYTLINKILLHSKWALDFIEEDAENNPHNTSLKKRVIQYCKSLRRASSF